ncbi:TonB-dependent receptor [Rhizorhabdus dicambivorans]|uniref:TonB-dependent receptor n=1 Tax=Rhizorhabdus dicambivorans TaxID=1850238 RepID=A0A2A4G1Y1_9SPHN|nr:TonB-dependent receptor [Rhizorhabdus dicambivorans]ATE66507.1 TonB-dependent receptor [Rhizorhabdus dicambivorans]PCE44011.1 TonB-dependent receptor [Rhizorhabdus dicambivorans]
MKKHLYAAGMTAIALVAILPGGAQAQTAAPATDPAISTIDDIVVTARRRNERLQEVPLAVSAVSAAALERANIQNVAQLSRLVPSLTSVPGQGGSRSLPNFSIRGLSQQELTILADQSVSTYIGDIVAARTQGINSTLFDIASVEVLRGPQGTLFGRNTTGGAIIIRPARPTDEFEGRVGVTVGNLDTFNVEGMVNVPLTPNVAIRIAGQRQRDDGFVYDEILGRNVNDTRQEGVRASLLLHNDAGLESLTVYNYFHENDGGTASFLQNVRATGSLNGAAVRTARGYRPLEQLLTEQRARGIYRIANGSPIFTRVETHDVANTTSADLSEQIKIKNIIGYRRVKDHIFDDMDGTSNSLHPQERIDRARQFSEELQLLGDTGSLNWITGLYYFREKGRNQGISAVGAVDPGLIEPNNVAAFPGTAFSNTDTAARNSSYAAFAQGTYRFGGSMEGLSLTAGIRYNRDKRQATIRNRTATACRFTRDLDNNPATPETAVPLAQCQLDVSDTFSEVTYNLSLEYKIATDKLVYIAHRHGYRTGGFGARAGTEAGLRRTFSPETVDDIEIGVKADWRMGDAFLRTNFAGYYAKYKDIQRLLTDPLAVPPTTVTTNAGRARIWGIEADILFRPVKMIELTANYAYTNAEFTKFIYPDGTDHSNDPFARAPRNVYTLGARVIAPLADGQGNASAGISYYHTDGYSGNDTFVRGYTDVKGYNLLNLDASWNRVMGSAFDVALFVNNVTRKKYDFLLINLDSLGYTSHTPGLPRTYGATVRVHF